MRSKGKIPSVCNHHFQDFKLQFLVVAVTASLFMSMPTKAGAQTTTIPSGSFIVNMGVTPQTVSNALKPYGMIYHLIMEHYIPVLWVIDPGKTKDGTDFTYNSVAYKGGPFIITAEYRTADINTEIQSWVTQGVVGVTTSAPFTVPTSFVNVIQSAPRWTLDKQNGSIAVGFFQNALIPSEAYGGSDKTKWKNPADLGECDDIFVMPHADPLWSTHGHLLDWNLDNRGSIWLGCHAGSALEDMFNPAIKTQQTNFLSEKNAVATGAGPYCENALVLWTNHDDGTLPYSYGWSGDPIMQFMGIIDGATTNGSEQIYITTSGGWRTSTKVGVWDPDHPQRYGLSNDEKYKAAVLAYGNGMGDPNRGLVMLEAAHDLDKAQTPPYIAAQRAFFNFSFLAGKLYAPLPAFTIQSGPLNSYDNVPISFVLTGNRNISEFNISWSSSPSGTFTPPDGQSTVFKVPKVSGTTICLITLTLTEKSTCARIYRNTIATTIVCNTSITPVISPACYGQTNGKVEMTITGGPAPYNWTWTKTSGGSGSGSGTGTTISNLSPGGYTISVTTDGGNGCTGSVNLTVPQNSEITANATPSPVLCNGGSSGSITLSVSGGTGPYTYLWSNGATTRDINGLSAGSYSVTVTDSKLCTKSASATVSQPDALSVTPTITHVTCNGASTGSITLSVTGGTGTKTYAWNDGASTKDRTGIPAGTYSVTVTDANNCSKTVTGITVNQPSALTLSLSAPAILCNGLTTVITATAGGGTGTYTYSLDGGPYQLENTFTVHASGNPYSVTVKDANGCTITKTITVGQPDALALSVKVTNEYCPGQKNGAIDLTVTGGTGPFTYDWSNDGYEDPDNDTEDLTALVAGSYTVIVTDANGCTATTTATVIDDNPNPVKPGPIKK